MIEITSPVAGGDPLITEGMFISASIDNLYKKISKLRSSSQSLLEEA